MMVDANKSPPIHHRTRDLPRRESPSLEGAGTARSSGSCGATRHRLPEAAGAARKMVSDFGNRKPNLIHVLVCIVLQQLECDPAGECIFGHRAEAAGVRAVHARIARYERIIRARKGQALLK